MSQKDFKNLLCERGVLRVNVGGILVTLNDLEKAFETYEDE